MTMFTAVLCLAFLVPNDKLTVRGQVTDDQGRPVAGAIIQNTSYFDVGNRSSEKSITTNDRGEYSFDLDWSLLETSIMQRVDIVALKAGVGIAQANKPIPRLLRKNGDSRVIELSVQLEKPTPFDIHVQTPEDQPLDGAEIEITELRTKQLMATLVDSIGERFGQKLKLANGKCRIDFLPANSNFKIACHSVEHGTQSIYLEKSGTDVRMKLRPTGSLTGTTVDETGISIRGVQMTVTTRPIETTQGAGGYQVFGQASVKTDANGKFHIEQIAVGNATIQISSKGNEFQSTGATTAVILKHETTDSKVKLGSTIPIRGQIVDQDGGAVPNVRLSVNNVSVLTNANGEYQCRAVPGQLRIGISNTPPKFAFAFGLGNYFAIPAGSKSFDVPDIELKSSLPIRGVVVDELGKPVAGASVSAGWMETSTDGSGVSTTSGDRDVTNDAASSF